MNDTGLVGDATTAPSVAADNVLLYGDLSADYPLTLKGGEFAVFRWNAAAIHAKANTVTIPVEITIYEDRSFTFITNFDLLRLEPNAPRFVARYKSNFPQQIQNLLNSACEIVRVERTRAVSCKADRNARAALSFSRCRAAQCWRRLTLRLGIL